MPKLPLAATLSIAALATPPLPSLAASGANGVEDPVVAWNLADINDWDSGLVFIDVARTMRAFFTFKGDAWGTMDTATLRQGGWLDDAGYATAIPDGQDGIRTIFAWTPELGGAERAGTYVFTYKGRGDIQLAGDAEVIQRAPGRIIFTSASGGTFWIDITGIVKGDHPRDFSIVRADKLALHEAGAMFDPAWLRIIADARELRFMGWMRTNEELSPAFADRPEPQDAVYTERGVPIEVMVRLANEVGADPWFTIHHDSDDDTIRAFATYVRDHLDPRLKAHVEYSNEIWNASFPQFGWLHEQAVAEWGDEVAEDWEAIFDYHVKQSARTARIWRDVFGPEADTRLVTVLGTQANNTWLTGNQMVAANWRDREPDSYIPPTELFDEVAATTYFSGSIVTDDALRAELLRRADTDPSGLNRWIYDTLSDPGVDNSMPDLLALLPEQKAVVAAAGLRFTAYEGGQHVHHSFAVEGLTDEEAEEMSDELGAFVRSAEMARLYARLWEGWRDIGDGPFMQFTEMGQPSRWGSWGLMAYPGDHTPRSDFLLARQAEGGSWWGEGGGPQYLQGVTATGGESADTMDGSVEEDFLAGLGGDDSFAESGGQDGINGGAGTDRYSLAGPRADYRIEAEGAGQRITGPRGSTFVVNVEELVFADGEKVALSGVSP